MPRLEDARDLWAMLRHNMGLSKERPTFRAFSYAEKVEYLAYVWGSAVMAATGCLLWFNTLTLTYLPSWVADAATVTHFYEAVLATLSILVWHLYMVVFDPAVYPMDLSWITGQVPADHLRETRPGYYRTLLRVTRPAPAATGTDAGAATSSEQDEPDEPGETD
jgi:cytochrome b subunit of formate dehydrogenase